MSDKLREGDNVHDRRLKVIRSMLAEDAPVSMVERWFKGVGAKNILQTIGYLDARAALQDQTERCPNPECENGGVRTESRSDLGHADESWKDCPTCGGTGRKDAQDPSTSANCLAGESSAVSGAGVEEAFLPHDATIRGRDDAEGGVRFGKGVKLSTFVKAAERWYRAAGQSSLQRDGWRPIETAPKDGTVVLLYPTRPVASDPSQTISTGRWHQPANPESSGYWITRKNNERPTLWQPLPTPPTTEEEGR